VSHRNPRVLTIAGSDSGGGAGIQADLKTFAAHGAYGMSVVTAVTAQNTVGVRAVEAVSPELVAAQIDAVFEDLAPDAVKVGMLANAALVEVVAERLRAWSGPPLVVDPVMIAASGDPLLTAEAVESLRRLLLPLAALATPNLPEGERLAGRSAATLDERRALARDLARYSGAVLLKGGHAEDGDEVVDILVVGADLSEVRHPRLSTTAGHGSGCTLSAAIAARLARGELLTAACGGAIIWLCEALAHAERMGSGVGPLDALWTLRSKGRFA